MWLEPDHFRGLHELQQCCHERASARVLIAHLREMFILKDHVTLFGVLWLITPVLFINYFFITSAVFLKQAVVRRRLFFFSAASHNQRAAIETQ